MAVFWAVAQCSLSLMMEAGRSSETLVNLYQTTRRYNPEDSHLSLEEFYLCFGGSTHLLVHPYRVKMELGFGIIFIIHLFGYSAIQNASFLPSRILAYTILFSDRSLTLF
jgi:hypothetical protein